MIVDQSDWGCVRLTGTDRVRFLQGMCMGNIATLTEGAFLRTATLNAKGRLLSIFDVVAQADQFLLLTQPGLAEATAALLDRYAIADDVAIEVVAQAVHRVWDTPEAVWTAPPVLTPPPSPVAPPEDAEVRRVEAGLPLYGVDVDEECFPFETPLGQIIDYNKGCYVGQEPVARVHARGTPSRLLRGLRMKDPAAAAPAVGATIAHPDRKAAGNVTSAAASPRFGAIALGFLHRTAWDPGGEVSIDGAPAVVVELPFH